MLTRGKRKALARAESVGASENRGGDDEEGWRSDGWDANTPTGAGLY